MSTRLLLYFAMIALMSAGSGGVPLPCQQDTICLMNYDSAPRLTVKCLTDKLMVNFVNGVDHLGHGVLLDTVSGCMRRNAGLLLQCTVTETDHNGKKKTFDFTYNCTGTFRTSTSPAPMPSSQKLTAPSTAPSTTPHPGGHRRHHTCAIAATAIVVPVFLLLVVSAS